MNESVPGAAFKRPGKPRFVRVVCRHAGKRPGWRTHEFLGRLVIRLQWPGPQRDLSAERQARHGELGNTLVEGQDTYRFSCPRCHRDLQLRADTMLWLIDALDEVQRQRTGDPAARVQRLDISAAESVLRFRSQAE